MMFRPGEVNDLSDYEKQRLENIARNQRVLEGLGLVRSDAEAHQELRAGKGAPKGKKQKLDPGSAESVRADVRRSQRLAGLPASDGEGEAGASPSGGAARTHAEGTVDHSEARAEYDLWTQRWSSKQAGVTIVGTASYAHTLMRVMTMSERALANRTKAIERACGQHAVAKMKLFATILALEGYVELAEDASSAYGRLREKLGDPASADADDE
uniref:Uncharacterized protein n=1 Tax=Coccolithus braarudii TaxID=221442 RepID=A0A7S0QB74_9EUKA